MTSLTHSDKVRVGVWNVILTSLHVFVTHVHIWEVHILVNSYVEDNMVRNYFDFI